jgi:hypothetical protein
MLQSWLSASGIAIDLAGFLLLLREWWLAFFHESAMLAYEQRRGSELSARQFHHAHAPNQLKAHLETTARLQDQMAERNTQARHLATLGSRRRVFLLATVLIVIGYLLQLAGALPEDVLEAALRLKA